MYALLNSEQLALQETVEALATAVGITNPVDLEDRDPAHAWVQLEQMGLLELRRRDGAAPIAGGVEVMVVAQALAWGLVPVPYVPSAVLATELLSLAKVSDDRVGGLLLRPDLTGLADSDGWSDALIWGGPGTSSVLALDDGARLVRHTLSQPLSGNRSVDLTQGLWDTVPGAREELGEPIPGERLDAWLALALSTISADMVGIMRRALHGAIAYSKERIAYGQPVGSFQAIQHLAAETHVTIEAAYSTVCYAAWCVDETDPAEALLAARTAKAYCASVARTATENVMQIYGGVGQTWEHPAHFYTRRALLGTLLFGDENAQLAEIARTRLGGS
ncbi:acyl-CoA dehydrogenase [Kribbella solani]|uniref:Alkylation response protein AidB-like acyl-CoA dehydrogenase n=1 Tax=Kribbella solani TaxID=236067 RepID=A0A841DFL3_9ACTN|nr:acyl-CoA dehydrogenase [Kribbella solani]MBB5977323.1 alkylation response protein AidB-like acyl-CoA dehydrogenase [Kribbella solani]